MSTELHIELDRIFAARNRDNMGPTIAALLHVYERHPLDPRVLYEVGGAYDTAGEETTALGFYERAMTEGARRGCASPVLPPIWEHPPQPWPPG